MPASVEFHARPDAARDAIALTFDDGPDEWTTPILEVLEHSGARATFFVVGEAVEARPDVLRATFAAGHEIGNHTYSHPELPTLSADEIRAELDRANDAVNAVLGDTPKVFRPPYFKVSPEVLEVAGSCGFPWTVQASVVAPDYALESAEAILAHLGPVTRGAIIDLHDGRPSREPADETRADRWPTVHAVARLVPQLLDAGFEFVTVSELLEA